MSSPHPRSHLIDIPMTEETVTPPDLFIHQRPAWPGAAVRRLPIGAEPQPGGGVHFRVWASRCRQVLVEIDGLETTELRAEPDGYFSVWSPLARAGMRYRFRLDQAEAALPDPASRFQPEGPHGPSEVIDPDEIVWTDGAWRGVT